MKKKINKKLKVIKDYDEYDVSEFIDKNKKLSFKDIGYKLPKETPTQVVSIRIPTKLLNELRAMGSEKDVPYQSLIKLILAESVEKKKKAG